MLRDLRRGEDVSIGRVLVTTMMRRIGIEAVYRRPNASKPMLGHKIHPHVLRDVVMDRPQQAWAMDIS